LILLDAIGEYMIDLEPFDEDVEVNGQTVLAVVAGAAAVSERFEDSARRILAQNGIDDPQPDEWYPQSAWLAAFEAIANDIGDSTLRNIGMTIPANAEWPPDVDSVAGGLESINRAYHMNHRGGDIGHYRCESVENGEATVVCENPYPCSFDQGIVEAVVDEFNPDSSYIRVEETSEQCRDDGSKRCQYRVSW
jgi:hypothetical protein